MWAWALTAVLASFGALASCGAKICELAFGSDSTNFGRAFGHSLLPLKAAGLRLLPFAVTGWGEGGAGDAREGTAGLETLRVAVSGSGQIAEQDWGYGC